MRKGPVFERDRASLGALLLYDSYDPEGGVFVHRDGSLGLAWRTALKDAEVASEEELEGFSSQLADFFRGLPAGSAAQFILVADRDVREALSSLEAPGGAPNLEGFFRAHRRALLGMSLRHGGIPFVSRSLRAYFTLRVFPDFSSAGGPVREAYLAAKRRLLEDKSAVEGFFGQLGLGCVPLGAEEFVRLLYRLLNPRRAQENPERPYREDLPIRDQVVRSAARFEYDRGILTLDGVSMRVLSMVRIPERTFPGMTTRAALSGAGVLDLVPEAVFAVGIEVLADGEMRRRLEKKDAFAWRQLQGPRRRLELVRIKEDAEGALGEILSGRRGLSVRFQILLSGRTPEEVLERSQAALGAADRLGIEMVEEDALALTLFLQSLPLMYDPAADRGLKRAQTMIATNVADLLPLYGSFRGTQTPDLVLQNRRGEPIGFSLFDSEVAPHAVVTGVSGSGKSFFMNYLLASVARRGAYVAILDRGGSYRNLAELLGGQYVAFDPDRPVRINPIGEARSLTPERLLFVKDILAELAAQGEEPLRKEERTVLENAVLRAVARKGEGELFLSDVYEALLEEARSGPRSLGRDLDRLVLSLKPFVGKGVYAGFFDGPSGIDFRRDFTVFELGEIALRKEVAPALLMAILHNVAGVAGAPEHLARRKYVVVDEAWTLLQSPATARFVENALRTYRKLNAAAVMVTQQAADFAGPSGTAIRANAPNRIFLRQTPETIVAMKELFDLSPEVREALESLVTAKGVFSEMLLETASGRGIARLVPSRELYAVFSTDGEDRARLLREVEARRRAGDPEPLFSAVREIAARGGREAA
jgi:conjugal transfer ATP-binding protein TraC